MPSVTHLRIGAAVGAAALLAAGCGSGDRNVAAAKRTSAPLGLEDRVAKPDEMPGLRSQQEPRTVPLATFASEHRTTVAKLHRAGILAVAESSFAGDDPQSRGISLAERMRNPALAEREARRLFAVNSRPGPGIRTAPLSIPEIGTAQGVAMRARLNGQRFTAVEIVWTAGPVVHELFAIGPADDIRPARLAHTAAAIARREHGRPLPPS
jgi:hypothetical protein